MHNNNFTPILKDPKVILLSREVDMPEAPIKEHTELGMKPTSPPCPDKPFEIPQNLLANRDLTGPLIALWVF